MHEVLSSFDDPFFAIGVSCMVIGYGLAVGVCLWKWRDLK